MWHYWEEELKFVQGDAFQQQDFQTFIIKCLGAKENAGLKGTF